MVLKKALSVCYQFVLGGGLYFHNLALLEEDGTNLIPTKWLTFFFVSERLPHPLVRKVRILSKPVIHLSAFKLHECFLKHVSHFD